MYMCIHCFGHLPPSPPPTWNIIDHKWFLCLFDFISSYWFVVQFQFIISLEAPCGFTELN
jgi:hypothetical protein